MFARNPNRKQVVAEVLSEKDKKEPWNPKGKQGGQRGDEPGAPITPASISKTPKSQGIAPIEPRRGPRKFRRNSLTRVDHDSFPE